MKLKDYELVMYPINNKVAPDKWDGGDHLDTASGRYIHQVGTLSTRHIMLRHLP